MKKKLLFLVTVLAFMVAMPIASAEVLEAKDTATLVEMVKKAKDGDTVKLVADITGYDQKLEINGNRTITLDMNGHNITYLTGSKSFIGVYGATLIVKGSGVITNDTDSGLNVYGKETKDDSFVSKLVVEKDVTLKGKYGLAIFWDVKNGSHGASVDFYGKVDVTNNGIATNGDILNEDGPVVNIKKGAVVKSTGSDGVAVYCAGNGTYNIEEGATITGATGIEVRAGKLNVKGGTITGTAKELTSKANGGGSTTVGAGIAVVQHTTQLPIEVNITGGTITGAEALYVNNTQGNPTTAWAKVNVTVAGGTFNTDVTKFLGDKYVVNKNGNSYAVVENKVLETTDEKVIFESEEAIPNDFVLKVTEKTEDEIKKGTEKVTETYKDNKKVKEITWKETFSEDNKIYKPGTYKGTFTYKGEEKEVTLIVQDTTSPVIEGIKDIEVLAFSDKPNLLEGITVTDNSKEEITATVNGEYNIEEAKVYNLSYTARDSSGNETTKEFKLTVKDNPNVKISKSTKGYTIKNYYGVTYVDGVVIANKTYSLPSNFAPNNLVTINGYIKIVDYVKDAFTSLVSDAKALGLNIYASSGYRSYNDQKYIYNSYVARDGVANADTYSARAGYSEHQTGLAIDVNTVDMTFDGTAESNWLRDNCYKYGFVLRYLKGKENITGYMYEPWHIRYMGKDMANKLYNNGSWITLEEYYGIDSKYSE